MGSDKAVAFLNLGMMALHSGHDAEAVRSFRRALEVRTDMVEAYIGLGLAYGRMDEHVKMIKAFRKSIEISPAAVRRWAKSSIPDPHHWLSLSPEFTHITGKMAEFLHSLDEADALTRLAAAHIANCMDEAAITALEYCLKLVQDYEAAIILLSIAYLLIKAKDEEKLVQASKSSMLKKVAPNLAKILFSS